MKSVKVEIRYKCGGHMGDTHYSLVASMDGEELIRVPLCSDGFNDGDPIGWQWETVKEK